MATKSFVTEFKFSAKSGHKLINAIENSKKTDHVMEQRVNNVTKQKDIDKVMNSFLGED